MPLSRHTKIFGALASKRDLPSSTNTERDKKNTRVWTEPLSDTDGAPQVQEQSLPVARRMIGREWRDCWGIYSSARLLIGAVEPLAAPPLDRQFWTSATAGSALSHVPIRKRTPPIRFAPHPPPARAA